MAKYLTFFSSRHNVNIHDILGEFIPYDSAIVKIQTYLGLMAVCKLEVDIDFTDIPEESINFFQIKLHDINTLRQYLREISEYAIMEDSLSKDSFSIYGPWKFNELTDHIYPDQKPYDNWIWNEKTGNWTPPIDKPIMDNNFTVEWNQSQNKWNVCLIEKSERKYRGFTLWKAVPKLNGDFYEKACHTTEFMLKSFENITHGTNEQSNILSSDHNRQFLKQKSDNSEHISTSLYRVIKESSTILDFSPYMLITYSISEKEYVDSYQITPLKVMHPQCICHTLHELFRLIIEWAWSYRELNNTEPIAVHCDTLLRELQMPLNVRKDLLDIVPDQAVSKYIKGYPDAAIPDEVDPECPESFKNWISDILIKYKKRNIGDELKLSLTNLPDYYPCLLYTSPSPRDLSTSRMPSSA